MTWITTLAKYRMAWITVAFVLMSMVFVPSAFGAANSFGLEYGTASGLGTSDIRQTVAQIINVALSLLGIVALVIILAGGFKWMTAGGNEEKVGEARKMIFSGIIGLAIILSAFAIARFVLNQLSNATGFQAQAGRSGTFNP
jgi:hypothetical protein